MAQPTRKADWKEIADHIDSLLALTPGDALPWWPKYIYHFTDLNNAVSILTHEAIYSRQEALTKGLMANDNASTSVIGGTGAYAKSFARFYFRPQTPTQHNNEGFRPVHQRDNDSHCPVPIYFLLNAKEVLTRQGVLFTDGNLKTATPMSTGKQFAGLPWDYIYHNSSLYGLDYYEKRDIINCRHAEVVVPNSLALDETVLKYVVCRSPAELDTLLFCLPPKVRKKWQNLIGQPIRSGLFFGKWTFVESAELSSEKIQINFNPSTFSPGPFRVYMEIHEVNTGTTWEWLDLVYYAKGTLTIDLSSLKRPDHYRVKVLLDDHLAYASEFLEEDIPF